METRTETQPAPVDASAADRTAMIVAAYVANMPVTQADLPALIRSVHQTVAGLGTVAAAGEAASAAPQPEPVPAIAVSKSVTDDYIVCLEDGKRFKSLRRHLNILGMTPEQYRAKWNLPHDYPMVAPSYAEKRSRLAKEMGLGRRKAELAKAAAPARGRGRPRKAEAAQNAA